MNDTLASLPATESARLVLRPLAPDDAEALQGIANDTVVAAAITFIPHPFGLNDARRMIAARDGGRDCFIGAWSKEDGSLVGVVGTHLRDETELEIGYFVGAASRGQGYVTEAARAVIAMLAEALPARRIIAECRVENRASWRVLEKLGFVPTGAAGMRPGRRLLALTP